MTPLPLTQPDLGLALRSLRGRSGLTQEELALRSGIHWTLISKWERAVVTPGLATLARALRALQVELVAVSTADATDS